MKSSFLLNLVLMRSQTTGIRVSKLSIELMADERVGALPARTPLSSRASLVPQ